MSDQEFADDLTPADFSGIKPSDPHAFLKQLLEIARLTGDCDYAPPINYDIFGDWLPEPACEPQHVAWRRIKNMSVTEYNRFSGAKAWYRARLRKLFSQGLYKGDQHVVAFYLALRHFPPGYLCHE